MISWLPDDVAFVRFKKTKGTYYLSLVENHWDSEKKQARQKHLKYIGRIKGVDDKLPASRIRAIFKRDNNACRHCNRKDNLTLGHIISMLIGGTNQEDNLHVLCFRCNARQGKKTCRCINKQIR